MSFADSRTGRDDVFRFGPDREDDLGREDRADDLDRDDGADGDDDDDDSPDDADALPDGSAYAMPGVDAIAAPTPNVTANAPTRPM